MRVVLAQLAPRKGDLAANADRAAEIVRASRAELVVFPELFLSGYRVGDGVHAMALRPDDPPLERLREASRASGARVVVGAPMGSPHRRGEVHNAAVLVHPDGPLDVQIKRFLPSYGPFEEGSFFTPTRESRSYSAGTHRLGLQICYDAFFPEVSRDLAMSGADLLVVISAAPSTSRRLFEKVLPARAVENAVPLVYVNRVGVEDGVVFGGGSGAWDPRGEPIASTPVDLDHPVEGERAWVLDIDLDEAPRWRPFRPVLRDAAGAAAPDGPEPSASGPPSVRTDHL